MPETAEEREKRELRELEGKNISHYSVLLSTWISTRMERDKTLITLSSAAIGLLVTILSTVGINKWIELILYSGTFLGFGTCISSSLKIYQLNSDHIEAQIRSTSSKAGVEMEKYDKISKWSFLVGVTFFCIAGLTIGIGKLYQKEITKMTDEKRTPPKSGEKSLTGLENLGPKITQTETTQTGQDTSSTQESSSDQE